jgi:hypothetical protein
MRPNVIASTENSMVPVPFTILVLMTFDKILSDTGYLYDRNPESTNRQEQI